MSTIGAARNLAPRVSSRFAEEGASKGAAPVVSTAQEEPEADTTLIEVSGLTKTYQLGDKALDALQNVSMCVQDGEFVTLVGPSGCGKSTLLNIVGGLVGKTSGTVRIHGRDVLGPRRDVGMMFQTPVLLPWRTNLDNILLPAEVFGLRRADYLDKAHDLLNVVGLEEFAERYPYELSGGMQQRVAICRMLLCDPLVLLMDEPFSALDEMTREYLNMELLRVWDEHRKTVLFVTHNIGEAVLLSDRVIVMSPRPGRIAEIVPIELDRPRDRSTLRSPQFFDYVTRVRDILG